MVAFIIVVCEIISTKELKKARTIILAGCAVYAFVVVYECVLIYQNISVPELHGDMGAMILQIPQLWPLS
jgi:hypothetical protein